YRLPELKAAPATATLFICEGEKDTDTATKLGLVATTPNGGASRAWPKEFTPYFAGRDVVIFVDADAPKLPGRPKGQKIAKALHSVAASIKGIDLFPDRNDGSDLSDWVKEGGTREGLDEIVTNAPLWRPGNGHDTEAPSVPNNQPSAAVNLADFVCYMPTGNFIFMPARELWPAN